MGVTGQEDNAGPALHGAPPVLRAALWMIGAIVSFSAMAIAGREISIELDTFEIMMYRSLVGLTVVLMIGGLRGTLRQISHARLKIHVFRNICHFAGQNLWFFAITVIPLAQVFALEFTSPLWVLILSPLFLSERFTPLRALAAAVGFAGILLVARPAPGAIELGTIAAATAAIGFAGTLIFTKRLTRTESLISILFWMTLMQSGFGFLCAGIDGDIALPSGASALGLLVIGFGGLLAHFCLTTALSIAPATVVAPIDFARLPLIALIGYWLYSEALDVFVITGALMIFGANYLNIWSETRQR